MGRVRFGSLRRVRPIDPLFGSRWGQPIDRYYIEHFLRQHASDVHGRVLEIGDDGYTKRFGGERVSRSDVLHYTTDNPKATIVADLTHARNIDSGLFDCIVLTQTLQVIYDVRAAVRTLHRILKPGGTVLCTSHGISQLSVYDIEHWGEYWRLTRVSAHRLFSECFGEENVTVGSCGNVLAVISYFHGLTAQELSQAELDYHDPAYELILTVRAVKSNDS